MNRKINLLCAALVLAIPATAAYAGTKLAVVDNTATGGGCQGIFSLGGPKWNTVVHPTKC